MIKKTLNKIFKTPKNKSKKGKGKKKKITNTMKILQAIDSQIDNIRKNPIIIDDRPEIVRKRLHPVEEHKNKAKSEDISSIRLKKDIIDEISDNELIRNEQITHEYLWNKIKPILDDFKNNKMDNKAKDKFIKNLIDIRNNAHELYDPDILDTNLLSILDEYKNTYTWIGRQKGAYDSTIAEFRNKYMKK